MASISEQHKRWLKVALMLIIIVVVIILVSIYGPSMLPLSNTSSKSSFTTKIEPFDLINYSRELNLFKSLTSDEQKTYMSLSRTDKRNKYKYE